MRAPRVAVVVALATAHAVAPGHARGALAETAAYVRHVWPDEGPGRYGSSWGRHGFDGAASASCASRARCAPDTTQHRHDSRQRQQPSDVRSPGRGLTAAPRSEASGPAGARNTRAGGGGSPHAGAPSRKQHDDFPAARHADKLVEHDVRAAPDAGSIPAGSTTSPTITLRIGGMVVFGAGAPAGAAPFAQLVTRTPLGSGPRAWALLTSTEITAAPGAEFNIAKAETWRALDFAVSLSVPLRRAWVPRLIVSAGAQALAYQAETAERPAARRAGVGLRVSSGPASHIELLAVYDERGGGAGVLLSAGVDIGELGLVGSALVGRHVTMRVAAVRKWGR